MKNQNSHFLFTAFRIAIIVFFILCTFCLYFISPYKEWHTDLKIVDYDVVDLEKVAFLCLTTVNIVLFLLSRKSHKAFVIIHVILAAICFARFSWLMTL